MMDNRDVVVLIADDEPGMLALLSAYLKSKGYKVIEAPDGERAWQLAHEHLPDLVILDVMMPAMSGWEVCRKIREALPLAHTGVIMLTGIGENLNEMTSPLYGADAHIDKPFEFSDLEGKMREVLATRRKDHTMGRADDADVEPSDEGGEAEEETIPQTSRPEPPPERMKRRARAPKAAAKAEIASEPPEEKAPRAKPPKKAVAKKAAKKVPVKKAAKKASAKKAPAKKAKAARKPGKITKKVVKKAAAKRASKKAAGKKAGKKAGKRAKKKRGR